MDFHLIGHSSTTIKRVCRATVQAEAYSLGAGSEEGDRIRAAVADLLGKLDVKRWEASSAAFMKQIWFTDCKSVYDNLRKPISTKMADKRLSIEMASMRQNLWHLPGETVGSPALLDQTPGDLSLIHI